jgi:hypothetical protein
VIATNEGSTHEYDTDCRSYMTTRRLTVVYKNRWDASVSVIGFKLGLEGVWWLKPRPRTGIWALALTKLMFSSEHLSHFY